jgi:hypothetical protein
VDNEEQPETAKKKIYYDWRRVREIDPAAIRDILWTVIKAS